MTWPTATPPVRSVLDLRHECFPNLTVDDVGFVEERNGEPVGYCGVVVVPVTLRGVDGSDTRVTLGGLSGLCVDPDWRGVGIGSRLVTQAEAWIAETFPFAALFTGTPAFYERLGYEARSCAPAFSTSFMVKSFSYPWLPDTLAVLEEPW